MPERSNEAEYKENRRDLCPVPVLCRGHRVYRSLHENFCTSMPQSLRPLRSASNASISAFASSFFSEDHR